MCENNRDAAFYVNYRLGIAEVQILYGRRGSNCPAITWLLLLSGLYPCGSDPTVQQITGQVLPTMNI